jgi:hypothetical protein
MANPEAGRLQGGISGKRAAQERVEQIQAFRREFELLAREGALSLPDQVRSRLEAHHESTLAELARLYDVDVNASQRRFSLGMRILSTLGGAALCMALVLYFYRIWGYLSTPVQVAVLILAPIAALAALEAVSRKDRTRYYTGMVGLVALAAFILDLNVLGQMFNVAPSPEALLAWSGFALIIAYGYHLRIPLAAGLTLAAAWAAARGVWLSGGYWTSFGNRSESFVVLGALIAVFPLLAPHRKRADFCVVYRMVGLVLSLGALQILMHMRSGYLPLSGDAHSGVYQVLAFAASALVVWLGVRHDLPEMVNIGSGFFTLYLFDRLFSWWWDWMPRYLFFLIIGTTAVALLAVFRRLRARKFAGRTA